MDFDFTVDEMVYLNKNAIDLPKSAFLNRMKFHIVANVDMDLGDNDIDIHLEIVDFMKNLFSKISALSDEEWTNLQNELPFIDLPYSDYDTKEYNDFMMENV